MFRSHVDFFAILAITLGLITFSRIPRVTIPILSDAVRLESPANAGVCPLASSVAAHIEALFGR